MPPAGYPAFLQYLQSGRVRQIVCVPVIEEAASFQQELTHGSRRIREQQAVGDR